MLPQFKGAVNQFGRNKKFYIFGHRVCRLCRPKKLWSRGWWRGLWPRRRPPSSDFHTTTKRTKRRLRYNHRVEHIFRLKQERYNEMHRLLFVTISSKHLFFQKIWSLGSPGNFRLGNPSISIMGNFRDSRLPSSGIT